MRNPGNYNEQTISAMLIISQIITRFSFLNPNVNLVFKNYFNNLENYVTTFQAINNTELRKVFLLFVRRQLKNWHEIYINLFPYHLQKELIKVLVSTNHQDIVIQKFLELHNSYRIEREPYIWLVRNCWNDDWFSETGISREKVLISMIHLWDITARDIDTKHEVVLNRKLNKQVYSFLIKDDEIVPISMFARRKTSKEFIPSLKMLRIWIPVSWPQFERSS